MTHFIAKEKIPPISGADEQKLATPVLIQVYVAAFLQTGLFLVHLFFCERNAVPVQ